MNRIFACEVVSRGWRTGSREHVSLRYSMIYWPRRSGSIWRSQPAGEKAGEEGSERSWHSYRLRVVHLHSLAIKRVGLLALLILRTSG